MSNKQVWFHLEKNGHLYKLWLAAVNHREFQRIMKIEDFEIILVSTICDEIMDKMSQSANDLQSIGSEIQNPMRLPFLEASQLAIGLVCVYQQQVKFLYEQVSRCSLQSRFIIEQQRQYVLISRPQERLLSITLPSKRKRSSIKSRQRKTRRTNRQANTENVRIVGSTEETSGSEVENEITIERLENMFVKENHDITIREVTDESTSNEVNNPTDDFMDIEFNEIIGPSYDVMEDQRLANTLEQTFEQTSEKAVEHTVEQAIEQIIEQTVEQSLPSFEELLPSVDQSLPSAEKSLPSVEQSSIEQTVDDIVRCEPDVNSEQTQGIQYFDSISEIFFGLMNDPESTRNSIELNNLKKHVDPQGVRKMTTRKRKRLQSFKDQILKVDVEQNMKTVETTQRHLSSLDDCTDRNIRLKHLYRNWFDNPSHMFNSESSCQRFKLSPTSNKLLNRFKRGTLLRTERTNPDLVNDIFHCVNEVSMESSNVPLNESHINTHIDIQDNVNDQNRSIEQSPPTTVLIEQSPSTTVLIEQSLDEAMSLPAMQIEPLNFDIEQSQCQPSTLEISPQIREILHSREIPNLCDKRLGTYSQQMFIMKSRQNRHDWGAEGVLRKLLVLWNSGIHPIGMEELMQSTKQRLSAATAFFSIMELNSLRIDLIDIEKDPNSNIIYNILKSPKFIQLQQTV